MTNAPNTPTSDGLRAFITTYGYKDLKVASRQYCADIYVDDEHCMTEWFDDLSKAVQFADGRGCHRHRILQGEQSAQGQGGHCTMRKHDLMQCLHEETMWFPTSCWDIRAQQRRLIPSRRYSLQESSGVKAAYLADDVRKADPEMYQYAVRMRGATVDQTLRYVAECEHMYKYMRSTCRMTLKYLQASQDFYMDNFEHLDMDDVAATKRDMVEMDSVAAAVRQYLHGNDRLRPDLRKEGRRRVSDRPRWISTRRITRGWHI